MESKTNQRLPLSGLSLGSSLRCCRCSLADQPNNATARKGRSAARYVVVVRQPRVDSNPQVNQPARVSPANQAGTRSRIAGRMNAAASRAPRSPRHRDPGAAGPTHPAPVQARSRAESDQAFSRAHVDHRRSEQVDTGAWTSMRDRSPARS